MNALSLITVFGTKLSNLHAHGSGGKNYGLSCQEVDRTGTFGNRAIIMRSPLVVEPPYNTPNNEA